jgi:hypothetical protein
MIFLLSGEGPTDLGACQDGRGVCASRDFRPGPMAMLVSQLVEEEWGWSPLDRDAFVFVAEGELSRRAKEVIGDDPKRLVLRGEKVPKETAMLVRHAQALARLAKEHAAGAGAAGAVLFRDTDGTRTTETNRRKDKVEAIDRGFESESFGEGVPMVPKPKSEAWLLCAFQKKPYTGCAKLEEISGNDRSPRSAKRQLAEALKARRRTTDDLPQMVEDRIIDGAKIKMPSYDEFATRLRGVASMMKSAPRC